MSESSTDVVEAPLVPNGVPPCEYETDVGLSGVFTLDLDGVGEDNFAAKKIRNGLDKYEKLAAREVIESLIRLLHKELIDLDQIESLFGSPEMGINADICALSEGMAFVRECLDTLRKANGPNPFNILVRKDWSRSGVLFRRQRWPLLQHHNDEFLTYRDGAYHVVEPATIRASARDFLERARVRVLKEKKWTTESFQPSTTSVNELIAAVQDARHKDRDSMAPPCWLHDADKRPLAKECIALQNGILHVKTGQLIPATPDFFVRNALEFDYDASASCLLWLKTINEWWSPKEDGAPADEVLLLQEEFGYLITNDTSLQKIFFHHGVARGGKGTTNRLLARLVGESNVCSPSIASFSKSDFAEAACIGKSVAVWPEFKFGPRDDRNRVSNFLKATSGEDSQSLNRKNMDHWEGTLGTRMVLTGQRIPDFEDDSNAIANRLVILRFTNSFLGREDKELGNKLAEELPGILNWAIEGWHRLMEHGGHFTKTAAGIEDTETVALRASPIRQFVEDACVVGGCASVFTTDDVLFSAFKNWCTKSNEFPGTKSKLVDGLGIAYPGLVKAHRIAAKVNPDRPRGLQGIRLAAAEPKGQLEVPF